MRLTNDFTFERASPESDMSFSRVSFYDLGSYVLVPFPVTPLQSAKVAWLNERWFLDQGIDIGDVATRGEIEANLLETFAVQSHPIEHVLDAKPAFQPILYADRYGQTGGSPHGGSGRVGTLGGFNAKGIGPTPLVSNQVDFDHSHGFMRLREAVNEAICAEVADTELPLGAIRVVAIIDAGEMFDFGDGPEPRGLVVRPNFVRLSHFERSIYFGKGGATTTEQYIDAQRVKDAVNAVERVLGESLTSAFDKIFDNIAEQISWARALRLWPGRFLSSNATVTGALVDFGIFRAVPNWSQLEGVPGERFGDDSSYVLQTAKSMGYYFGKFVKGFDPSISLERLRVSLDVRINRGFISAFVTLLGFAAPEQSHVSRRLGFLGWKLFQEQQKKVFPANSHRAHAEPWLSDAWVRPAAATRSDGPIHEISLAMHEFVADISRKSNGVANENLRRAIMPRSALYYSALARNTANFLDTIYKDALDKGHVLSVFIANIVVGLQVYWPLFQGRFDIQGAARDGPWTALVGIDLQSKQQKVLLECRRLSDMLCFKTHRLTQGEVEAHIYAEIGNILFVSVFARREADGWSASLGQHNVNLDFLAKALTRSLDGVAGRQGHMKKSSKSRH